MKYFTFLSTILSFIINVLNATIIDIPTDYSTIQEGIEAAVDGDTVLVHPGTYYEYINFMGKAILVGSFYITTGDTNYAEYTTIRGQLGSSLDSSIVTFNNEEDTLSKLIGFTIKNGTGNNADPDNVGVNLSYGGGIYCENSSPLLKHLIIENNECGYGGGGGIFCYNSSLVIENTRINNNISLDVGGGIYIRESSNINLTKVNITSNQSSFGGGIYLKDSSSITIKDAIISDNTGSSTCGGILGKNNSNIYMTNSIIKNNQNNTIGGAVYLSTGSYFMSNNIKIFAVTSSEPTISIYQGSNMEIHNSIIKENNSNIGIHVAYSCIFSSSKTIFAENTYSLGVIVGSQANINILNSTLTGNITNQGVINNYGSEINIINSILYNLVSDEIYIDLNSQFDETILTVAFSDIYGGESAVINHYLTQLNWLDGNINTDPLFNNPDSTDFSLQESSPCIDAGTSIYIFNIDTLISLPDSSYNGNAPDMGAIESSYTVEVDKKLLRPKVFMIYTNYPNPFNPNTNIRYYLPEQVQVSLVIYDILGREVRTLISKFEEPGYKVVTWDGTNDQGELVGAGVYFYKVIAGDYVKTKKMVLLK